MHPRIQGQDVSGVDVVQEGVELRNDYLEYRWRNPGEDAEREKAMYLAYFEPWQWIFAASSYKEEFLEEPRRDGYRQKLASFGYISEYDWIVASSAYKDEFEAPLQGEQGASHCSPRQYQCFSSSPFHSQLVFSSTRP